MDKKLQPVYNWLLLGCFLIGLMVIIGGITRLTQSGLSMVDWKLYMGSIPPMNDDAWRQTFEAYQQYPEYQIVNKEFTLEDFKSIFWWEYIHRLLGRLIGIIFIIPFLVFLIQKRLNPSLTKKLIILLILGGFQGFLGWYMVKSGLVNNPHVSHFRLAAHLIAAFAAFGYSLWLALGIRNETRFRIPQSLRKVLFWVFGILLLQIIYGAFVAGLKAGLYYNTWPLMGGEVIPKEAFDAFSRDGFSSLIHNITSVQFIHRTLAILVSGLFIFLWMKAREVSMPKSIFFIPMVIVGIQFALGVTTLIMHVPVFLGVLHQLGALILFAATLIAIHRTS